VKHRFTLFPTSGIALAALLTAACSPTPSLTESTPSQPNIVQETTDGCDQPVLNVVATVGMVADVAQMIGGNCVTVTAMMGAGVDPHLYTATESDVELLFGADVVLYGGLNLESRMTDVFTQMSEELGKPIRAVSENVPEDQLLREPENPEVVDPHVWMDVSLWAYAADAVREQLIALDATHEAYYTANAQAYAEQLEMLDAYVMDQIAQIPEAQRVLVTAHDAFQYFGRAYGIDVYAPQGITTAVEVGVEDIRATINLLVERQIPAIFVEASVSPDVIEAIQAGARDRGLNVEIGGSLFSDSMGTVGTPEGTYIGMIRANTDTIVGALLGQEGE
jgi:manganese/zinc/iron transport system substrate-binding protein